MRWVLPTILALAVAACAAPQPRPKRPWRTERIELPPEFAPTMTVKGVEHLRFAPGMFDPALPDYFTYAFILVLEGKPAMDHVALQALLAEYFDGLMRAVAKDRKLDIDIPSAQVKVWRTRANDVYRATVGTVDAFVTARPLSLHMHLLVSREGDRTCVLALASPRPDTDRSMWDALRAQGAQLRCEP